MELTINTSQISYPNKKVHFQKDKNNYYTQAVNSSELPNFDSVGRSLVSFRNNTSIENEENNDYQALNLAEKSIQELEETKKLLLSNQEDTEKRRAEALANLEKIKNWNYTNEYNKQKLEAENEIDRQDLSRFWNPFKCKEIREAHYNKFVNKYWEINRLKEQKSVYENTLNLIPLNSAQIKSMIVQIDAMIEQKKQLERQRIRQEGIDGVQKTLNAMNNKEGGVNDRIAGYEYEKDELDKMFIEPLVKSKDDPNVKVPAAVLLYGATGTGKTTFLNGIGEQTKDFTKIVDLSQDIDGEDFPKEIKRQMKDSSSRYFEKDEDRNLKRTRTVLLINEAEKFLSMTPSEAKVLYGDNVFDEMDMEFMEQYGHDANYINNFKSLLDTCSDIPENPNDTTRAAMTIFITSNYPHLIHPDLLSRDGKMPFIAINPARDENIEAVIKHYFKKANSLVERIKIMDNPDGIKDLTGLTKKAKANIKQMMENGTIDNLFIDYENIPYDKFAKEFNPSMKKGAFSNDAYRKIAEKSCNMYLEDPSHTYEYYFSTNLIKEDSPKTLPNGTVLQSGRDINPQRYKKFVSIFNMLAPADPGEKQLLLRLEKMDMLDEKARKRLDYIRIKEESELKNLEEKELNNTLSDEEKIRIQELRNQNDQIEEIDDEDE